jgi:hypothetical protein
MPWVAVAVYRWALQARSKLDNHVKLANMTTDMRWNVHYRHMHSGMRTALSSGTSAGCPVRLLHGHEMVRVR